MKTAMYKIICIVVMYFAGIDICSAQGLKTWIDRETGRQVVRVASQPYATLPYFTANIISRDGSAAVYVSAQGLHLLDLKNFKTELLVPAHGVELQCIEMGRRTDRLFFVSKQRTEQHMSLLSIDLVTRKVSNHARLPQGYRIATINADETLAAGVREESVTVQGLPSAPYTPNAAPATKGELLYSRVNAAIPMALVVIDLGNGAVRDIHRSTAWLSHPQFSPIDSQLLMYAHEGPWHQVDRIWTIRADGSERQLIHRRSMDMEIVGHEFWSSDGASIHYDWQRPKGQAFYLASYNLATQQRSAVPLTREQWSIHFNPAVDPLVFVGDGADVEQVARSDQSAAIWLYRVHGNDDVNKTSISAEKLVDLRGHDYSLEPNARLTPDRRWVLFRSNIFGSPGVFAVRISGAVESDIPVRSTFDLARQAQAERRSILMKK